MDLSRDELKEIIAIFQAESQEHLETLNKRLLELEKTPQHMGLLEEIFRTAHSLKGAARMIGLPDIEKVAHELENIFGLAKRKEITLSHELFDVLYEGVDAIAQIISAMSAGQDSPIDVTQLSLRLKSLDPKYAGVQTQETPVASTAHSSEKTETVNEVKTTPITADPVPRPELKKVPTQKGKLKDLLDERLAVESSSFYSKEDETIRVSTKKLDDLMNQAGELLTAKIKFDQRTNELKSIMLDYDEWNRDWDSIHSLLLKLRKIQQSGSEEINISSLNSNETRKLLMWIERQEHQFIKSNLLISALYNSLIEDTLRTSLTIDELQEEVKKVRLLPIAALFNQYPRMVRDIARAQMKDVELVLSGQDTQVDKKILEELKDPIMHLLRNAVDHGIEPPELRQQKGKHRQGVIQLSARYLGSSILIEVEDDGKGIDVNEVIATAIKKEFVTATEIKNMTEPEIMGLLFRSGFSTAKIITDISGRGVGLDVVRNNIEKLKGIISISSSIDKGIKITIRLPLTLSTTHALLVESMGEIYALPVTAVEMGVRISQSEISLVGNREVIIANQQPIPLVQLDDILEKPRHFGMESIDEERKKKTGMFEDEKGRLPAVVVGSAEKRVAFLVNRLLDEQEIVVKNLGSQLRRVRNVAGTTILGNRRVAMILDPSDLIKSAQLQMGGPKIIPKKEKEKVRRKILIVDDSITTRTLEKNILETAGFDITIAVDGQEAWNTIHQTSFDLVVSDIEMPTLNGFELTSKIRADSKYSHLPIILVTSLESESDKRRGIDVGANAYITKGAFNQNNLLETIERLL